MPQPLPGLRPLVRRLAPGRLIPFPLQKLAIEHALAHVFREPLAAGTLDFLEGRWVGILVEDAGIEWYVTRDSRGLRVISDGVTADVTFRGNVREFILLASRRLDPDTLFFQRRLSVTGSTELGLACKNVMDSVEREQLPPLLQRLLDIAGDVLDRGSGEPGGAPV